ncbi:heterokaryon incompatibility protein-domain-containing protein [Xylaria grammica]|nr:heterokaryon incompatibility protein-domain-containing protein [Xylaria grammica]
MTSAYEHQPLTLPKSIRVLTLEPAISEKAPITCSLEEVDLDNITLSSSYEALSYVWGEKVGTIPIQCHGKQLLVTPNCYDAIVNLRRGFHHRRLFIDAICIDQRQGQQQEIEKGRQIPLMGEVYEKAYRTICWLGESDPLIQRLLRFCRMIHWAKHLDTVGLNWKTQKVFKSLARRVACWQDFKRYHADEFMQACASLFQNPWFRRLWTLQEQYFANWDTAIIVSGRESLKYKAFRACLHFLPPASLGAGKELRWLVYLRLNLIRFRQGRLKVYGNGGPFFEYVSGYRFLSIVFHLDSTRQEDKIFGLYAIFDRAGLKLPDPDTSKTVAEVFEDATRVIIQESRSLTTILRFCIRETCVTEDLPSWVPDWSMKLPAFQVPYLNGDRFMDDGRHYDSSKGRSRATNRDITIGELHCPGTIVGKVNFLVSPTILTQRKELDLTCIEACRKWFQHISSSSTYCTGGSIIDAAKRTLQFGPKEDEMLGVVLFSKWFDLMLYPHCQIYGSGEYEKEASSLPVYEAQTSPLGNDSAMMLIMTLLNSGGYGSMWLELMEWSNYALMVLDTGHFARGFRVCKKGDVVALLAGCEAPVALRPDGNGNYIFVTVLYVDGIMDGEAWPDDESKLGEIVLV